MIEHLDDRTMIPRSTREWWSQTGSNRRPPACKAGALPAELWPRKSVNPAAADAAKVVGLGRFELPTSRLSSARSNQLSYKPVIRFPLQRRTGRFVAPLRLAGMALVSRPRRSH